MTTVTNNNTNKKKSKKSSSIVYNNNNNNTTITNISSRSSNSNSSSSSKTNNTTTTTTTKKKKMKYNIVIVHLDLGIGGAEQLILQLAQATIQNNYQLQIVTTRCDSNHCFEVFKPPISELVVSEQQQPVSTTTSNTTEDTSSSTKSSSSLYPYLNVWGRWIPPNLFGKYGTIFFSTLRLLYLTYWIYKLNPRTTNKNKNDPDKDNIDVIIVDVLPTPLPFLRYLLPHSALLYYCHYPDQLLVRQPIQVQQQLIRKKKKKSWYRSCFDTFEEHCMNYSDLTLVNSYFTQETVLQTFPNLLLPTKNKNTTTTNTTTTNKNQVKNTNHSLPLKKENENEKPPVLYPALEMKPIVTIPDGTPYIKQRLIHQQKQKVEEKKQQQVEQDTNENNDDIMNIQDDIDSTTTSTTFVKDFMDPTTTTTTKNKMIVLSLNRYERKKKLELVIYAVAYLLKHEKDEEEVKKKTKNDAGTTTTTTKTYLELLRTKHMEIIIAGGYDTSNQENVQYYHELQRLQNELLVGPYGIPSITFLKSISDLQRTNLLLQATVVLYTPPYEHFGIVPLEAMYHYTPVIAWNNGGPKETIQHMKTGYLVNDHNNNDTTTMNNNNDNDAFGPALHELLGQTTIQQYTNMCKNCHIHVVKEFHFTNQFCIQYRKMIEKTINNHHERLGKIQDHPKEYQRERFYYRIVPIMMFWIETFLILFACYIVTRILHIFGIIDINQSIWSLLFDPTLDDSDDDDNDINPTRMMNSRTDEF